ncbi:U11 U12 small nuclear ribonucleo 48 kDa -like [Brachionus plicatilis]|uniref:U11 U12 small nuclear ribonucleo 48 kDa-like n=1 Tax=Brachionus plicatilis TaxID=10195 RepID=A0A3M7PPX5_BRAPC|nr:U11 U12 small nuclear ribonucleo 48 kDa -like [Brachionus plicatilis]
MIKKESFEVEKLADKLDKSLICTQKLEDFVDVLENGMTSWLQEFNWNKEEMFKDNDKSEIFNCPFDPGHQNISGKNFEKHVKKCQLKALAMTNQDLSDYNKQPDVYSPFQIVIDKHTQNQILHDVEQQGEKSHQLPIPFEYDPSNYREKKSSKKKKSDKRNISMTTNHLYVNFTPAERLKLHEYAVDRSKTLGYQTCNEPFKYQEDENRAKQSKEWEHKRATRSHKTSKGKTHTEEIRELIDAQMKFLIHGENKCLKRSQSGESHESTSKKNKK